MRTRSVGRIPFVVAMLSSGGFVIVIIVVVVIVIVVVVVVVDCVVRPQVREVEDGERQENPVRCCDVVFWCGALPTPCGDVN